MFKAANPYDELVAKATDENLTSENWELNLDVCDKVAGQGESGARDVIASLSKRLVHRSANVQLYSLTLADALSKNVSPAVIYPELSSRSFCNALARLVGDARTTHARVRARAAALVQQWALEMRKEDEKGGTERGAVMQETLEQLRAQHPSFFTSGAGASGSSTAAGGAAASTSAGTSANGPLPPPEPSSEQLRREDEELRRALELSLHDQGGRGASSANGAGYTAPGEASAGSSAAAAASAGGSSAAVNGAAGAGGPSASTATNAHGLAASRVRALYDFVPTEAGELAFSKGDIIRVLDSVYEHWWRGEVRGDVGIFPVNYIEILPDPTPEDIQRDAELEARIFSGASSIDALLAKLSSLEATGGRGGAAAASSLSDDDELQELYQQALALRPKIVRLIDRYSAKVAELKGLNDKFVKARGTFEGLMEQNVHRWEPNRAPSAAPVAATGHPAAAPGMGMGYRQASYTGSDAGAGAHAPAQPQPQAQQDHSQAWAAYYAHQQQASGAGAGAGASASPAPPGAAPAAGGSAPAATGVPQPPPGLDPRDPAYAQWYYAHFGHPGQQQPAGAGAGPSAGAPAASTPGPSSGAGPSGSGGAADTSSGSGGAGAGAVPQDDEKRRLFERARAEAEAYQAAHHAYLSGQAAQPPPAQPVTTAQQAQHAHHNVINGGGPHAPTAQQQYQYAQQQQQAYAPMQ